MAARAGAGGAAGPLTRRRAEDNWITAIGSLRNTDLVASGSHDGVLRLWKCDMDTKQLLPASTVKIPGFINGISFANSGRFVAVAVGQEHRLGRWWRHAEARNGVRIVQLHE